MLIRLPAVPGGNGTNELPNEGIVDDGVVTSDVPFDTLDVLEDGVAFGTVVVVGEEVDALLLSAMMVLLMLVLLVPPVLLLSLEFMLLLPVPLTFDVPTNEAAVLAVLDVVRVPLRTLIN